MGLAVRRKEGPGGGAPLYPRPFARGATARWLGRACGGAAQAATERGAAIGPGGGRQRREPAKGARGPGASSRPPSTGSESIFQRASDPRPTRVEDASRATLEESVPSGTARGLRAPRKKVLPRFPRGAPGSARHGRRLERIRNIASLRYSGGTGGHGAASLLLIETSCVSSLLQVVTRIGLGRRKTSGPDLFRAADGSHAMSRRAVLETGCAQRSGSASRARRSRQARSRSAMSTSAPRAFGS